MIQKLKIILALYLIVIIKPLLIISQQFDYSSFTQALQRNENPVSNNEKLRYKADQFLTLGMRYYSNDMFLESIDCFEKADSLYKSIDNKDYHAYTLTHLYSSYHVLGDKDKYNAIRQEIIDIESLNNIKDETIKLILSTNVGKFYEIDGDYEKALKFYNKLLDKESKYYEDNPSEKFSLLYTMTSLCLKLSDISNASQYVEALKGISKLLDIKSKDFFSLILIESEILHKQGNIGDAIKLLEKYATQLEEEYEIKNIKSSYYDLLGGLYIEVGDLEDALKYSQMALELCKETNTTNSQYYAISLLNMSERYGLLGDHLKALELATEACNIMEMLYSTNHPMYYASLKKLANAYLQVDQNKSKALYDQCLILSKDIFGDKSNDYADMLINSNLNFSLNPSENEINNVKKGIDIKRNNGCFDEFYIANLYHYSLMLFVKQEWTMLYEIANEILEKTRNYVISNFRQLSNSQRDALWKNVKSVLDGIESYATHHYNWASENHKFELVNQYSALAYDARLLKKGLLLTSTQRLEKLINNSVNSEVINIRKQLNLLYQNLNNEACVNDKGNIQITINNLERRLIDIASINGDFVDFININWQDIQAVLMPGEVAIEFFSYPCQDDIQYGMSYIGSDEAPLALTLFTESELNKFRTSKASGFDYDNPDFYKTIWSALDNFSEIKNAHTIYFSPDGILNVINIENLRDFNGKLASDKRYLCRVSSTRELFIKTSKSNKEHAILYGGLKYEMGKDSLVAESRSGNYLHGSKQRSLPIESLRYGVDSLKYSLNEVTEIGKYFHIKPTIITGAEGIEESFKSLDGSSYDIIHLATHGFFWDNDVANKRAYVNFLNKSNFQKLTSEENAMLRSGLVFSGANVGLMGNPLPDDVEDGVLTAKEISNMNLDNVDLVVMSACESGLGENTSEGVFGLQRGFKLAGANSLLMSLWKVNDKATSELMIEFYKHYLSGKSKQESLRLAQLKLRNSAEYSDPKYWAAFILLDALN